MSVLHQALFSLSMFYLLSGCVGTGGVDPSTDRLSTSAKNYRDRVTVTLKDSEFFSMPSEVGCFPLVAHSGMNCAPKIPTSFGDNIQMEAFEISLKDRSGGGATKEASELMHLAISDVVLSRGFKNYTVTKTFDVSRCSSAGPSALTSGVINGGVYSATTTVFSSTTCSSLHSLSVLAFNDPAQLARGVLYRFDGRPHIYENLYRGEFPIVMDKLVGPQENGAYVTVPMRAWKTYYDASGMSLELRKKYQVAEGAYPIVDERKENRRRAEEAAASPLNTNRRTQ